MTTVLNYIAVFLALLVALPVHEFAHAFVAYKSGDLTAKMEGRLTLNPMAHFDMLGLLSLLFFHFGWGKPVPINPYNFKHRRLDSVLVSLAGIVSNYLLAFIVYPIAVLYWNYVYPLISAIGFLGYVGYVIGSALFYIVDMSLFLAVFNVLPLYPLDGFNLFDALNTTRGKFYQFMRNYSEYILLALLLLGVVADITNVPSMDILGIALSYLKGIIQIPITAFWGLIF